MAHEGPPPVIAGAEGVPLIEGMALGRLLFPFAMAEARRVPPANDVAPAD